MRLQRTILSAVTLTALAACGSSGNDDAASSESDAGAARVEIVGSRFGPLDIEVGVGEDVTFVNNDPFGHTVTSRDDAPASFDSGELGQGETFDVTFAEAGTYDYFCQIHPTMRATVTVS